MKSSLARFLARALSQTLPHLAVLAVMLLALAPEGGAYWACEGQRCGASAWACCCAQPNDQQDAECGQAQTHFERGDHAAEAGPCVVDCHCTMVVQSVEPGLSSAPFWLASPSVFVAPVVYAPTLQAPIVTEIVRPPSSRGPPPRTVCLHSVSLRGPPVA